MTDRRRALPAVDRLLRLPVIAAEAERVPRSLVVTAVREVLGAARRQPDRAPDGEAGWVRAVLDRVAEAAAPTLRPVVNATGVVLHTNLGRAPLAAAAIRAMAGVAQGYSALEYDLATGARGSRHLHCTALLTELTGAADAMVVNNAASALVLVLAAAAAGGDVIVSRGELIEIGGGFRIPEIMAQSGAGLREVGTTNRTRLGDYEKALGAAPRGRTPASARPRALLKVHRSNFSMLGFTAEATLAELVALGRRRRVPVLYDLGGGLMTDLDDIGLVGEPTLPRAARGGAAAVVASGDKLLGGPQAGIIVGTRRFVGACRAHPLARAVRADKLTLAGLAATLGLYRDPAAARRDIPVLRLLTTSAEDLAPRARALCAVLPAAALPEVVPTRAAVGGGAFPGSELASWSVSLQPGTIGAKALAARLRAAPVPVIATVQDGRVLLDTRTLLDGDEAHLVRAVAAAFAS